MRCPKCGYISFDHVEKCLKCMKNIKDTSDNLHGTIFHAKAPSFLHFNNQPEEKRGNSKVLANRREADEDFLDEDLEVLVQDESETDAGDTEVIHEGDKSLFVGDEQDDREIEMDLSGFDGAENLETTPAQAETERSEDQEKAAQEPVAAPGQFSLELPEELIDISDLAPPDRDSRALKTETQDAAKKEDAGLEMDDLNFDLGLGDLAVDMGAGSGSMEETILALDDIDFSEAPVEKATKPSGKGVGANMDGDLNFDLDLGGLTIHKDL
jgi:hypothetical protein